MISKDDARPLAGFLLDYQSIILRVYPTDVRYWPLLSGWNIKQGSSAEQVYITDVAPTLAMMLNIQFPNGCTGKPISFLVK